MREKILSVPDMACGHCVETVRRALEEVEGVEGAHVSLETKEARIRASDLVSDDALVGAVRDAGYTPEP